MGAEGKSGEFGDLLRGPLGELGMRVQPRADRGGTDRELEEAGWKVKRERRLVPVELSDGRRMIVPIEEVDLLVPEVAQF